jgi:IS30 family transposase
MLQITDPSQDPEPPRSTDPERFRPYFGPPAIGCSSRHLSLEEREEISRGMACGESLRSIAVRLGRAASTVSREVTRNGGRSRYRAHRADRAAWNRARRPKLCKLAANPTLALLVDEKLGLWWSPQQISGWLKESYPSEPEMWVSHETIYLSLFVQGRGVETRANSVFTDPPGDPPAHQEAGSHRHGPDPKPGDDLPTSRRSRRPCCSRPLGRGPVDGAEG